MMKTKKKHRDSTSEKENIAVFACQQEFEAVATAFMDSQPRLMSYEGKRYLFYLYRIEAEVQEINYSEAVMLKIFSEIDEAMAWCESLDDAAQELFLAHETRA